MNEHEKLTAQFLGGSPYVYQQAYRNAIQQRHKIEWNHKQMVVSQTLGTSDGLSYGVVFDTPAPPKPNSKWLDDRVNEMRVRL